MVLGGEHCTTGAGLGRQYWVVRIVGWARGWADVTVG